VTCHRASNIKMIMNALRKKEMDVAHFKVLDQNLSDVTQEP